VLGQEKRKLSKIIKLFTAAIFLYFFAEHIVIPALIDNMPLGFALLLVIALLAMEVRHFVNQP
jgi:hypothetical protein